jgi:pilus assembly protein CpaF
MVDGDAGRRNRITDTLRALSSRIASALGDELHRLTGDALRERAEAIANEALGEIAQETGLPPGVEPDQLLRDVVAETVGLGPLEELMQDESVFAITIARPDRIYVDRVGHGRSLAPRGISSADAVHRMLQRIASRAGRLADLEAAIAHGGVFEARLDGGFALTAVVGALSASGASVIIRRGRRDAQRLADLAQAGVLSAGMADFLDLAVRARRNIVVGGAAGSGRSTLIGALARASERQRVVLVEESSELDASDQPWISITGAGGDARRAFAAALRMKPERVVVGDVRGAEALDVVAAMAGGLDGAIIGVTAGSSRDALARLSAAARMAAESPHASTIDAELGAGIHIVVSLGRAGEGEVRVAEIAEVTPTAEGPAVTPVFSLRGDGAGARFQASGHVPAWAEGAPASMFRA